MSLTRRQFCQSLAATSMLSGSSRASAANETSPGEEPLSGRLSPREWDWIRSCRTVIAEAYNPPFYPSFDYTAEKAVEVAKALGADSLRYPAASYFAYFPTKTRYPVHPELAGADPMKKTIDSCRRAGLKVVAYIPLNHPFMEVRAQNSDYQAWVKRFEDGKPMTTEHYGYTLYYEGCLNSPVRDEIRSLVAEVVTGYEIDAAYFDGPYMGMRNTRRFCYCENCQAAYRQAKGKAIPKNDGADNPDEEREYTLWLRDEVVIAFLAEIREMIRGQKNIPVLFNDTSLLSRREWRNRAIPVVDGFMFEAAETPEQKLFNLQLGHSTGKVIWTYVGTHTQYNREHMKNERVRGWFTYPVESEELLLDGATALAGNAGLKYWGLSRFFYEDREPSAYPAGRHVRDVFDFASKHRDLLFNVESRPQAGILVGSQTVDWFNGRLFMGEAYKNCYHGAFQVLKELSYDAEPFLDYRLTRATLDRYPLVYIPNAPCLSDAQCAAIGEYVSDGGVVVATHLTSTTDEFGRPRADFGLAGLFGAHLVQPDPVEIPDLYLKPTGRGRLVPQDPQVVLWRAEDPGSVLAETWDRGHRKVVGPAVLRRPVGKGTVIYIGSSLEAIYDETRMAPVRDYLASLIDPLLASRRTYEISWKSGLLAQYAENRENLLLHLLANTGNKWKRLRMREEYVPIPNVRAKIKIPTGRRVKTVRLLRAGRPVQAADKNGWLEIELPSVLISEVIHVELA